jgi:hypothetical protein
VGTDLQWTEATVEVREECQAIETVEAKKLVGTVETLVISQESAQSQRKIGETIEKIISKDHPKGRRWTTLREALLDKCHLNHSEEW